MNCVLMPLIWPVFMLGIAPSFQSFPALAWLKLPAFWTRLVADGTIFRLLKGELPVAVAVLYCRRNRRHDVHVLRDLRHSDVPKGQRIHLYEMHSDELSRPDPCHAGKRHPDQSPWHLAVLSGLQHDCCRLRSAPATLLYTTAITILFTLFVNYEQLLFDLAFPKLNWENETAAIKSNNRSMISVLIDLTVGAILIGAGYLLYGKPQLNIHITTSVMILLTAVLTFAMRTALLNGAFK